MADNYFTDYPERVDQIKRYSDLEKLSMPLEETFGEKGTYKNPQEAIELYLGILEEMGRYCAKEVRPTAEEIDRQGAKFQDGEVILPPKLVQHIDRCRDFGIFAASTSRKYGGMNLPRAVQLIALEMFGQACPNTALMMASLCMADFVQQFGTEEQRQRLLPKMITAEWHASMALTEPNAGSDLGKLRTSGKKDGNRWIVNGTKQFITGGNGHITFALVRTDPASTGLAGLSVIILPRKIDGKDNFRVAKIEDKICLHSSQPVSSSLRIPSASFSAPKGADLK